MPGDTYREISQAGASPAPTAADSAYSLTIFSFTYLHLMHQLKRFNVRVYGLLINDQNQLLVADEVFKNGNRATKYPGGGLELGEGLKDCLVREFKEETGIEVTVTEHFYTTDFFVASFFDMESQVISIYYFVESKDWQKIKTSTTKFDFDKKPGEEGESFRWVDFSALKDEDTITLPIDKLVTEMLVAKFS